ncbi:MAG: hypothetical protein KDC88_13130 [Ignavibacteriae bacterium]|nr:hypothetical protein [Ignavibacteriota bacterium]
MNCKTILVLSTIKTEDLRLSYRFSRQVKSKNELIGNLFGINSKLLSQFNIDKIIIINSNITKLYETDLTNYINSNPNLDKDFRNLLSKAQITNCNDFECSNHNCFEVLKTLNESKLIVYKELIDIKILHSILFGTLKPAGLRIIDKYDIIDDKNFQQILKKIYNKVSEAPDPMQDLDENNFYEKYLFELIDEKWIKTYLGFLKEKDLNKVYYVHGEDKEVIKSLICKTFKEISSVDFTLMEKFNSEEDEIKLNKFVMIELIPGITLDKLISKIHTIAGANHTIIIIDYSINPRINFGITIYLPNYKELSLYHSAFFLYYAQCHVDTTSLFKIIQTVSQFKKIIELLGGLESSSELKKFVNELNFSEFENKTEELLENNIIQNLSNLIENTNLIKTANTIKFQDGHWEIIFHGETYEIERDQIGVRILIEMLSENKMHSSSTLKRIVDGSPVDLKPDFESLQAAKNRILFKVVEAEKEKNNAYSFSDYLKNTIKFKKNSKRGTYNIISQNISPNEWKFELPSWFKS